MKTSTIKKILGCLLLACLAVKVFGQAPPTGMHDEGPLPDKLDRSTIPAIVRESYTKEYPGTTYEAWYIYPSTSYTDGTNWYVYQPSVTRGAAEFYVVEFTSEEIPYKVVYTKEGKKITTYKGLKEEVPSAVNNALKKGSYKDWTIKKEKEEIWRDLNDKKVYKVVVEKGKQKHNLYYREDGKLLTDDDKSAK